MARPRKPTALLTPDAFRKNPSRARPAEPIPSGPLGEPPSHMNAKDKAVWRELVRITPAKVLTNADRIHVEIVSRLITKFRENGIGGKTGISVGELAQLNLSLGKMGMTPADRAKISVAKDDKKQNAFANLDEEEAIPGRRPN